MSVTQTALAAARAAGNINIADSNMEVLDLSETSLAAQERQAAAQLKLEIMRRARTVHVPTNPEDVKLKLRELGEPICLFGEGAGERRQRLREEVARRMVEAEEDADMTSALTTGAAVTPGASSAMRDQANKAASAGPAHTVKETSYYAPQTAAALKTVRVRMAEWSFERARARLARERQRRSGGDVQQKADEAALELVENVKTLLPVASQVGDARRPLSTCAISPDGTVVATGAWSGLVKLWSRDCQLRTTLRGHVERVSDVVFADSSALASRNVHLATAGADGVAHLWSSRPAQPQQDATGGEYASPVASLRGHAARLCKVRFHPGGMALLTTSFDKTMRLWDAETQQCLQLQEGHDKEVYALAIHPDGSLAATGDLGGIGRLWDLRSGKTAMVLPGHIKQVLSMDFSPNGFVLASASDDHTVRVWDLRKRECVYTIPAHRSLVSTVKFAPRTGEFLVTSSFDGTVKAWSGRDYTHLAKFTAHESRVTCVDVAPDERRLVSCSFDRTFKVWTSAKDDEAAFRQAAASQDVDMT